MKAFRILAIGLLLAVLPQTAAHACSCITAPPVAYLQRAAAAFSGEVRLVEPQNGGVVLVTFRVRSVYKGNVAAEASVFTGTGADTCGIAFTEKRAYTVFASRASAGAFVTGLCDGTAEGNTLSGTRVIKDFSSTSAPAPTPAAAPVEPVPVGSSSGGPEPSRTLPIGAAAVLACGVTVAILRRSSAA